MTDENKHLNARLELDKAEQALRAALALADLGLWNDAVSRAYCAAYHAASAALYRVGIQTRTHGGTHDMLFLHLVKPGHLSAGVSKDLAALQRYREQADYSVAVSFDESSGADEVQRAARVVEAVRRFLSPDHRTGSDEPSA